MEKGWRVVLFCCWIYFLLIFLGRFSFNWFYILFFLDYFVNYNTGELQFFLVRKLFLDFLSLVWPWSRWLFFRLNLLYAHFNWSRIGILILQQAIFLFFLCFISILFLVVEWDLFFILNILHLTTIFCLPACLTLAKITNLFSLFLWCNLYRKNFFGFRDHVYERGGLIFLYFIVFGVPHLT